MENKLHLYLTKEGLESIAADYRRQANEAENFNGIRRAEGAAMAIEHILRECYPSQEPVKEEEPVI